MRAYRSLATLSGLAQARSRPRDPEQPEHAPTQSSPAGAPDWSRVGAGGAVAGDDRAHKNFNAVAHLYHGNSNRASVAWEAGLRR